MWICSPKNKRNKIFGASSLIKALYSHICFIRSPSSFWWSCVQTFLYQHWGPSLLLSTIHHFFFSYAQSLNSFAYRADSPFKLRKLQEGQALRAEFAAVRQVYKFAEFCYSLTVALALLTCACFTAVLVHANAWYDPKYQRPRRCHLEDSARCCSLSLTNLPWSFPLSGLHHRSLHINTIGCHTSLQHY